MSDSDLPDEQDQAEAFDEDNFNLDGSGDASGEFKTFEELPDVFDVTRALTSSNSGRAARHLESRGELSNEDLEELGYRDGEGEK
jgi:hypothetical protein